MASVYQQAWWPDYLPYYNSTQEVAAGKPWDVDDIQFLDGLRTCYIGGSASFDTVEDSLQYNLALVHRLFDQPASPPASPPASSPASPPSPLGPPTAAVEHLIFGVECSEVAAFVKADNATWTTFLAQQDGFVSKASARTLCSLRAHSSLATTFAFAWGCCCCLGGGLESIYSTAKHSQAQPLKPA